MHSAPRSRLAILLASLVTLVPLPAAAQLRVFFGNLHSHTSYSDGSATPEEAYRHARDVALLDFLAITEHNHLGRMASEPAIYAGPMSTSLISTASRFTVDGVFLALFGQEFSSISTGNHANVLEVGEVIAPALVPNGDWNALLSTWLPAHLDSQNRPAILLLNHPTISDSPNEKEYGRDDFSSADAWRAALDPHAELINMVNGPSHDGTNPGTPSEGEFRRYLNLGFHVAPTADQDNHRQNWGDAAQTRTGVLSESLTKAAILDALRNRRVYATQDRNLRVIVRIKGELMGTRVTGAQLPAAGTALPISVSLSDDDEPNASYLIEVFSDDIGGEEAEVALPGVTANGNAQFTINGLTYGGGAQYVFLRITQSFDDTDGRDKVWTAPVWFEPGGAAPAPPSGQSSVTLTVDRVAETAQITNTGDVAVDLRNWTLVSVRGNQQLKFANSLVLAPGASVVVTSGPNAHATAAGFVRWSTSNIWNNDDDDAELYDADGHLVAEHRVGP